MGKILVTGASGMLGVEVYKSLAANYGKEAIITTSRSPFPLSTYHFQLDLTAIEALNSFLNKYAFDAVVHCAAFTDINYCRQHPHETSLLHVVAPGMLAKKIEQVYYISTDSVFDGQKGNYSEQDVVNPLNIYADTKQQGETAVLQNAAKPFVIRCNIFGFHQKPGNSLFEWAYNELSNGNTINGFENVFFNPLYTGVLAKMITAFMQTKSEKGVYHFGSQESISKFEFLRKTAKVFGFNEELINPVRLDPASFADMRPLNTTLNTGKLSGTGINIPSIETCINQLKVDYNQYKKWKASLK